MQGKEHGPWRRRHCSGSSSAKMRTATAHTIVVRIKLSNECANAWGKPRT